MEEALDKLEQRADAIRSWVRENAPAITSDQKHLDEGTSERAYYQLGYGMALNDVLRLFGNNQKQQ